MANMFDRLLGRKPLQSTAPKPEADPKPDPKLAALAVRVTEAHFAPKPEPVPEPAQPDLALVIDSLTETLLQTKLPRSVVDLVDQIAADYDAGNPVGESAAKLLRTLSRRKKVPKKLLGHARTLAALTDTED